MTSDNPIVGCLTLILVAILLGTMFTLLFFMEKVTCTQKAKALGYKGSYGVITGCVLEKPNGKKVLLEQLRDFE